MSIVLAIDTAAPRLQLAVLLANGRVDTSIDELANGHAELIFARIATLLARNGLDYSDLARVVVTTGPGSFTGLRIGLSAARGIGLARSIPVIGVQTLQALSLAAKADQAVSVVLDARRGEAYVQNFSAPGVPLDHAQILAMDLARANVLPGALLIESPFVDVALLVRFGATLDPIGHAPEAAYVREADAKPQSAARIERTGR